MADKVNNEEYYDNLRQESYRAMLNSEIQATVAKDQALKYAQNYYNNAGLGNQGISESARTALYNGMYNANAQAKDTYRNALLKIAEDERNYNIAQQEKENAKLDNYYEQNDANLSNFLYPYLDENDGSLKNESAFMKTMTNYGADFNNAENPFENLKVSEAQKLYWNEFWNKYQDDKQDKEKNAAKGILTADNEKIFENADGEKVNFYQTKKHNANFVLQDADGNSTEWELGGKYTAYPNLINKTNVMTEAQGRSTGDIWATTNGNITTLVIKDKNGDVRMIDSTGKGKLDWKSRVALFSKYTGIELTRISYLVGENGDVVKDSSGTQYKLRVRDDGTMYLEKLDKKYTSEAE